MNLPNSRTIHTFFPTTVQITDVPNADQLNQKILQGIERIKQEVPNTKPESWIGDVYTTIGSNMNILEQEEFFGLHEIIHHEVSNYAYSLRFDIEQYPVKINECWLNVYIAGNSQEPHNHANSVFSGIYFVKTPKKCSPLILFSPNANTMIEPPKTETNELNRLSVRYEPKAGQMLIFRSHLIHAVKSSQVDLERVSISFNVTM